jgi:hypothetical protein
MPRRFDNVIRGEHRRQLVGIRHRVREQFCLPDDVASRNEYMGILHWRGMTRWELALVFEMPVEDCVAILRTRPHRAWLRTRLEQRREKQILADKIRAGQLARQAPQFIDIDYAGQVYDDDRRAVRDTHGCELIPDKLSGSRSSLAPLFDDGTEVHCDVVWPDLIDCADPDDTPDDEIDAALLRWLPPPRVDQTIQTLEVR